MNKERKNDFIGEIPIDLYKKLENVANYNGKTIDDIINDALEDYFKPFKETAEKTVYVNMNLKDYPKNWQN